MNELYLRLVKEALEKLSIASDGEHRFDDASTVLFAEQLRQIETTLYKTIYPNLRASEFVPFDTSVNKGAKQYGYYMLDKVGMAKLLTNGTTELEDVAVKIKRDFVNIEGEGIKYSWDIFEVYQAAYAGVPLTTEKADMARLAIAEKTDDMAVRGETTAEMYGFTNHPSISLVTPATGSWLAASGAVSATGLQMVEDIKLVINKTNKRSKKALPVTNVVMPPSHLQALGQTIIASDGSNSQTALSLLKGMFPGVTFEEYYELDEADAAGTGPRIVAYHKSKMVLALPVPIVFEALPPQAIGIYFEVNCIGSVGSIVIRYPLAMSYMDGC